MAKNKVSATPSPVVAPKTKVIVHAPATAPKTKAAKPADPPATVSTKKH